MRLKHKRIVVTILILLVVTAGWMAALHFFDVDILESNGTFLKGTTLNGVNVSNLTAKETEEVLQKKLDSYQLTVEFADEQETYTAKELGMRLNVGNTLKELIREQNNAVGAGSASADPEFELTAKTLFECEDKQVAALTEQLPELTERAGKDRENARLEYDEEEEKFTIESEKIGGTIQASDLTKAIERTAEALKPKLNAAAYGLYDGKKIRTANSAKMRSALKKANRKLSLSLTYTYDVERAKIHGEEKIDQEKLSQWLQVEENGVTVSLDQGQLQEYVTEMKQTYSVQSASTSQFVTSIGTYVPVNAPAADETVDTDALYRDIVKCVKHLYDGKRKAPYGSTSAEVSGTTDLGGTYVEIDLDHQHLYLYVDGKRVTEGDICSGCVADNAATPEGLYTIKSKDYDRYLRGDGYSDWVSYFMPFNGDIGLHDSTWRSADDYGGDVYLEEGSHGCINMPLSLAKSIDDYVEVGTYVILYGGEQNSSRLQQTVNGTNTYTKQAASGSFSLDAVTTGNGALTYTSSNTDVVTVNQYGTVTVVGQGTATITVTAARTDTYASATKLVTITVVS